MSACSAFGLNEFRKAPVGFIPQVDGGYLITVVQLPPGASLSRTDAVNRKVVDIALHTPGVVGAVNIVGFSGATFTNAPNSGAIFLVLAPFDQRAKDPNQSAAAIQRRLFAAIRRRSRTRGAGGRAAAGARHRQCRRLPHDDRRPRRPRPAALQGAAYAMMGRAAQTPGVAAGLHPVRDLDAAALSRYRPHQGAVARHQRAGRVRRAADLSRLVLCQRLQSVRPHLPRYGAGRRASTDDPHDVLNIRVRNSTGDTVPLGSFTTVRDISGPYRVPRYNLYPAAELDGTAAPGYSQGQAIEIMQKIAARDAARRLRLRVDDARLPADSARATRRSSPSCWRWCSCSWCWRRSSKA